MRLQWCRLVMAVAVATAFTGQGAAPVWGQASPPATAKPTPVGPNDAAAVRDGPTIVHSWALSPAFNEKLGGGNRPNLSYEVTPGSEVEDQITLFNLSNVQLTFRLYATDALNSEDGGYDLLPGDKPPKDVGTWVTVPQENITLPARTQATMPIKLKVPVGATPGDHSGGIVASNVAEGTGPDGKIVLLDRRTGPRLYVRVAGPLAPNLTVERLKTSYQPALNPLSGKADVSYRIENRGNVRMAGSQRLSFSGPLGLLGRTRTLATIPELLPGDGITVHASVEGAAATLLASAKVKLEPAPFGSAKSPSKSWQAFTMAPPYTLLAVGLSAWLLIRARRSYSRRAALVRAAPSTP